MKRTALLATLALSLISVFSIAKFKLYPDERPVEFMNSVVLGSKQVDIRIPRAYQMVQHVQQAHQHKMGFVKDRESLEKWNQYLSLSIATNTTESASMRISNIQSKLNRDYKEFDVIDTYINRESNGLQEASLSASYMDDGTEMILVAHYYSDSASLVGIEVSQKVRRSPGTALRSAEKIADTAVQLSNT